MRLKDFPPGFFAELEGDATPISGGPRRRTECPACGDIALELRQGSGRLMKHRAVEVEVPDDFPLPECSACGARPIDWKTAERLDPLLERAFQQKLAEPAHSR